MTKMLLVLGLVGCTNATGPGPLAGTLDTGEWMFAGGIYFTETNVTPPQLRVVLTADLSPSCTESSSTMLVMPTLEIATPTGGTALAALKSGAVIETFPSGQMATMVAAFADLAIDATGLFSGNLTAVNRTNDDDVSGLFTAHSCD